MTLWHKVGIALALSCLGGRGGLRRVGRRERAATEVVLVTHDSFVMPKRLKAAFERQSGLKLRILQGGDAGEAVNRALLDEG